MARTKLTENLIDVICQKVKLRMNQKQIAGVLGIRPETYNRWLSRGEQSKRGIYRKLVDRIDQARSEMYQEDSLFTRKLVFQGRTETTTKQVILEDGRMAELTSTKTTQPTLSEMLKYMATAYPAQWQQTTQIQIDYRQPIQALGLDPEQVIKAFFMHMERNQEQLGEVVIPAIPERTV